MYTAAMNEHKGCEPDDSESTGAAVDFRRLYAESLPRVLSFAARMLNDREAAQDVAQEAFAVAIDKAAGFRGESAALTWLLAITRNLCLKRLSGARERTFADIEALVDAHAEEPPAHAESERRFYVEEVKNGCLVGLLQCLPLAQRCAFILHLLNGEPIVRVARIMGKTENSVRILVSRARNAMRDFMCRNCSLMREGAACSCEKMINFSRRRNLLDAYRPELSVPEIVHELRRFADEVELFRSLPAPEAEFAELVASGRYRILAN